MNLVSQRLRYARQVRGWSQARVAEHLGTSAEIISRWERGIVTPSPFFQEKLCTLFEQNAHALGFVSADSLDTPETLPASPLVRRVPLLDSLVPHPLRGIYRLIGRDALLATLQTRLCASDLHPMVALYGLPGMGKTAIATTLAHNPLISAQFPDGVFWANLGPHPDLIALLSRWGTLLGMSSGEHARLTTLAAWQTTLRQLLAQRAMVFILDDVWTAEDALACTLGGKTSATLLTTRSPALAMTLAPDGAFPLPELSEEESLALLLRWVPPLVDDSSAYQACQALVRAVGGLPLALTLMGRTLNTSTYAAQPRRLYAALHHLHQRNARLRLSTTPPMFSSPEHAPQAASVIGSILLSVEALSAAQRSAFCALSLFPAKPNTFSEDLAQAVAHCSPETLDALLDAGLVECHRPGRYTLHQTIADCAALLLQGREEALAVQHRFIQWGLAYLTVLNQEAPPPQLALERANLFACLDMAGMLGAGEVYINIMLLLQPFLMSSGSYEIAASFLGRAYQIARALQTEESTIPSRISELCWRLGQVMLKQGRLADAERFIHDGLALVPSPHITARLLHELGCLHAAMGEHVRAQSAWEQGLVVAQQEQDAMQERLLQMSIGALEIRCGSLEAGKQRLYAILQQTRDTHEDESTCLILSNLGAVAGIQGEYETATVLLQEGVNLARAIGHRFYLTGFLANLALLAQSRQEFAEAERYYQEGIQLAREMGHLERLSELLANAGDCAILQGNMDAAETMSREGLAVACQVNQPFLRSVNLGVLGNIAQHRGQEYEAEAQYAEALAIAREIQHMPLLHDLLLTRGAWLLAQRRDSAARMVYQEMAMLAQQTENREWQVEAASGLAQAAVLKGDDK